MLKKKNLWRGLTMVFALLLAVSMMAGNILELYRTSVDAFLGTRSTQTVTEQSDDESDAWTYKSEFTTAKEAYEGFKDFAIEASQETFALLKNENGALPLAKDAKITMLGVRSYAPVYGNSGGSVPDGKSTVQIFDAFTERGFQLNPETLAAYEAFFADKEWTKPQFGGGILPAYAEITAYDDPHELTLDELKQLNPDFESKYTEYGDAAIVVVSRVGGEAGAYYPGEEGLADGVHTVNGNILSLSDEEMAMIEEAKANFDKVIVLVNAANPMEISNLEEDPDIDAILWVGYPGAYGFYGVADVLNGTVAPSAHLGDTFVKNGALAPAMQNFGNIPWANASDFAEGTSVNSYLIETEGIYTGYRYYETRYEDAVLGQGNAVSKAGVWASADGWNYADEVVYPFGYGLSYTTFTQKLDKVEETDGKLLATVTVTNTGDTAGKAVIELYAQTPYGDYEKTNLVEKSAIQLVAFDKTKLLAPGASETRQLEVDKYFLTAYDSHGAKGYILSEGTYYLSLGDDAHDALNNVLARKNASGLTAPDGSAVAGDPAKVYTWTEKFDDESYRHSVTGQEVTNRFDDADINYWQSGAMTYLSRQDWEGTYPKSLRGENALTRTENMVEPGYVKPADAPSADAVVTEKVTGLKLQDMWGMEWESNYWDELVDELSVDELISLTQDSRYLRPVETIGFPQGNAADGPDGVPNGNAYANFNLSCSSWNTEVLAKRGDFIAEDCMFQNVQFLWGPGFNVHRTPYSGRNFEYVSEDSCLAYKLGAANIAAMQAKGLNVGIKHFFANDQETHRSGLDTFATEQTLREICMRMFEGAFVEGHTLSTMLGTNNIGITSASQHKGSLLDVLRGEWGFKGLVITDACGGSEGNVKTVETIAFGANVFCFSDAKARSRKIKNAIIVEDDGALLNTLKERVKETLYAYANSNMMNCLTSDYEIVTVTPWWKTTVLGIDAGIALLTIASFLSFLLSWKKLRKKERNA